MYKLLDLFCGAGGASKGYAEAGFEVFGVDIDPQPHYPFPFVQMDVTKIYIAALGGFDCVHASPPCQHYSNLARRNGNAADHPDLVPYTRRLLKSLGKPYVIENVVGSPLIDPVTLCGVMFPELRVMRHRLFETNFEVTQPPHTKHPLAYTMDKRKPHYGKLDEMVAYVQVNGGGNSTVRAARDAMGIDWMTKAELNEAIPPAYTRYIGGFLADELAGR